MKVFCDWTDVLDFAYAHRGGVLQNYGPKRGFRRHRTRIESVESKRIWVQGIEATSGIPFYVSRENFETFKDYVNRGFDRNEMRLPRNTSYLYTLIKHTAMEKASIKA